jgi:hypothetical protein
VPAMSAEPSSARPITLLGTRLEIFRPMCDAPHSEHPALSRKSPALPAAQLAAS